MYNWALNCAKCRKVLVQGVEVDAAEDKHLKDLLCIPCLIEKCHNPPNPNPDNEIANYYKIISTS